MYCEAKLAFIVYLWYEKTQVRPRSQPRAAFVSERAMNGHFKARMVTLSRGSRLVC
jgi:hypothetical protein